MMYFRQKAKFVVIVPGIVMMRIVFRVRCEERGQKKRPYAGI